MRRAPGFRLLQGDCGSDRWDDLAYFFGLQKAQSDHFSPERLDPHEMMSLKSASPSRFDVDLEIIDKETSFGWSIQQLANRVIDAGLGFAHSHFAGEHTGIEQIVDTATAKILRVVVDRVGENGHRDLPLQLPAEFEHFRNDY